MPEGSQRYLSKIDAAALAKAAETELKIVEPAAFKIFVLALILGLRRNEIDKLRWDAFDFKKKVVRIASTDVFHAKTDSSIGEIPLADELVRLFLAYHKERKSVYVVESDVDARKSTSYQHYRTNHHANKLIAWLREKGVTIQKPLHTLRKEMGRILTEKYGIYAASKRPRHTDLSVTVRHYADDQRLLPTGLDGIPGGAADQKESG